MRGSIFILCIILILGGCETLKGLGHVAKGLGEGLKETGKGICKDISNTINNIKKLDQKFKENCW